jgi:uronate dehydrogenase
VSDARPKLLVTGSSGLIGSVLARELRDAYVVSGLDRAAPHRPDRPEGGTTVLGYPTAADVRRAATGCVGIVHLAGASALESSWDDVVEHNVRLTRTVLEGAVAAGARRVVLASSNHVTGLFEDDPPFHERLYDRDVALPAGTVPLVGVDAPLRPDTDYGVSKIAVEALGRLYAERHDLHVVCLRIGSVIEPDDPTRDVRHGATWCSQRDMAGFARAALRTDARFLVAYCVSANRRRIWALSDELGYTPVDSADDTGA